MPKGGKKRTNAEYEKEIEDAVKRFRKYPERIRSAYDSEDWQEFLIDIGVNPESVSSGYDFWESVREKTVIEIDRDRIKTKGLQDRVSTLIKEYETGKRYIETTIIDNKAVSQYREVYAKHTVYRDVKTGRFTKRL